MMNSTRLPASWSTPQWRSTVFWSRVARVHLRAGIERRAWAPRRPVRAAGTCCGDIQEGRARCGTARLSCGWTPRSRVEVLPGTTTAYPFRAGALVSESQRSVAGAADQFQRALASAGHPARNPEPLILGAAQRPHHESPEAGVVKSEIAKERRGAPKSAKLRESDECSAPYATRLRKSAEHCSLSRLALFGGLAVPTLSLNSSTCANCLHRLSRRANKRPIGSPASTAKKQAHTGGRNGAV